MNGQDQNRYRRLARARRPTCPRFRVSPRPSQSGLQGEDASRGTSPDFVVSRGNQCALARLRIKAERPYLSVLGSIVNDVPRINSGSVQARTLADGTRVFRLRFNADGRRQLLSLHERQGCGCGCGGGWDAPEARRELADVLAKVRLGIWRRPTAAMRARRGGSGTSFDEYARHWLEAKAEGAYGEIRAGTAAGYRCYLERHLLPAFDDCLIEEIDRARCLRLKATLIAGARELREATAAGREVRDERGRRRKPLGAVSIRSVLQILATILDEAVEDELLESNPARGKRMRAGAEAQPDVPGDGRASSPAASGQRTGRALARGCASPEAGRENVASSASVEQGLPAAADREAPRRGARDGELSPAPPRRKGRSGLLRSAGDGRDPRSLGRAGQRAVRPADRSGA